MSDSSTPSNVRVRRIGQLKRWTANQRVEVLLRCLLAGQMAEDDRSANSHAGDASGAPARNPESTFTLLDRARNGDDRALDELFRRHLGPLQRWARGRLPSWARDLSDTDDLVQETLLRTFKRLDSFDPRGAGALQAYLRQAIVNRVRDELRRQGRRPDLASLDVVELTGDMSPYEELIGRETLEQYEAALLRLQPEERDAIVARAEMGYSYEELAQVLGKPTADAARKTAQRALVRLAEEMRALRG
jgi:RNA polymerase sigma factor (sigma-70 family)